LDSKDGVWNIDSDYRSLGRSEIHLRGIIVLGYSHVILLNVVEQAGLKVEHNMIASETIKKLPTLGLREEDIAMVKKKIDEE